jgi:ribosomal protein L24
MKLDDGTDLTIYRGDRVEVCEGSLAGEKGEVVLVPKSGSQVWVLVDGTEFPRKVTACHLTRIDA